VTTVPSCLSLEADSAPLAAFEIGMFGSMMMQVGRVLGFATAYPASWRLLGRGIKEAM
jgi:hypothetical protein